MWDAVSVAFPGWGMGDTGDTTHIYINVLSLPLPLGYRPTSMSGPSPPSQQASSQQAAARQPSRLQEALAGIPLWVTVITAICILLQAAAMLLNWDEGLLSISAGPVIYSHEVCVAGVPCSGLSYTPRGSYRQ